MSGENAAGTDNRGLDGPQPGVSLERSRRKPLLVGGAAAFITLALLVFTPGDLAGKLKFITAGVCAQRPAHSYYMDGLALPVEARMVGIFTGFLLTWGFFWFIGRNRAGRLPNFWLSLTLFLMFLSMAIDGINATLYDFHWFTFYEPQNWLRLVTGTLSGIGMAGLIQPVFNFTVWKQPWRIAPFKHWAELSIMIGIGGWLIVTVLAGWSFFYWPLAFLTVAGCIWMLTVLNLMIYLVLVRRESQARDGYDLLTPGAIVYLFSLTEMAAVAILRYTLLEPVIPV